MPGSSITYTGAINGVNGTFVLPYAISNEDIYVAGLHLTPGTDYTLSGTTLTIVGNAIPQTGDSLLIFGSAVFAAAAGSYSKSGFAAAGTIINRVAKQCGLSAVADPYASTDANFVQLCEMLNMVGEDLNSEHDWAHFIREATIVTAGSATSYIMPSDFDRLVDQTEWNRSQRMPMLGPLSGQEFQYLKARLSGTLIQVAYRLQGNAITFAVAPADAQTLAFEYVSDLFGWSSGGASPDLSSLTSSTDTFLYDVDLAIAALRYAFLDAKGFDTTTARERYEDRLEHAVGKNVAAKVISMGGVGINADHLIDGSNLPITGYAQ